MTPLFLVVSVCALAVVGGLVVALRRLSARAHDEQIERAVFDEFDRKLAASAAKR